MIDVDEILDKLKNKELTPKDILNKIQNGEFNDISSYDLRDIADEIVPLLNTDDERISLLDFLKDFHGIPLVRIIRELENEDKILEYIDLISDRQKADIAIKNLKKESNRIKVIEKIGNKNDSLLIKTSLSREGFKKYFFSENDVTYTSIGLDSDITFGVEMETIGDSSSNILNIGKTNGIEIDDKKLERGHIIMRRRWKIMDNCSRWKFSKWRRCRSSFSYT